MRWVKNQVYFGGVSWKRFFCCGVFYFNLLGKYMWLSMENNVLRGRLIDKEKFILRQGKKWAPNKAGYIKE